MNTISHGREKKNLRSSQLAAALRALKKLQDKHSGVVESRDLTDEQRTVLVETGFLRPVMKGWYLCANPRDGDGDSTAWFASFWAFLSGYLGKRFGKRYCLNPEASLLMHTGNTVVPRQVVVVSKQGGNGVVHLPFDTSLAIYVDEKNVPKSRVEVRGLQVFPVPEALCRVPPAFFRQHALDAEIALGLIRDSSELLTTLLADDGMPSAASRLAGAMRFVGRVAEADRIVGTMRRLKYQIRETNPFEAAAPSLAATRERSPYVLRLQAMWQRWREAVIANFPPEPGLTTAPADYLADVQERYRADAYNSLSIEGYQVTDQLIERVAARGWNPQAEPEDDKDRDAMAARGYYEAFLAVKATIAKILAGGKAADLVRADHHDWYAALFRPAVTAGVIQASQLAGYRTGPVFIRNSMHSPLPREAILDSLEALFTLLAHETHAGVRAVLGHHFFVFIHPYFDGNGRIGRFLMNAMLASGGYPWTVVRMARRAQYMAALEAASVAGDIHPFAKFLAEELAAGAAFKSASGPQA